MRVVSKHCYYDLTYLLEGLFNGYSLADFRAQRGLGVLFRWPIEGLGSRVAREATVD